jgi:SNF2 family DNA or RNA helicase
MNWVDQEIEKQLQDNIPRRIAYWSSSLNHNEQVKLQKIMTAQDDTLDFLCCNVEAFSSGRAPMVVAQFIKNHYCLMIVDEATSIKNGRAQRTKNIQTLGRMCDYRRILTGTPITQSPLDLYAMCEFLKQGLLGFKSYVMFRANYAVMVPIRTAHVQFNKIVGFIRLDELTESLLPFSSRILKSECLDLPEKIYETVEVSLSPEQAQHYQRLKDTAVLQLDQGLLTSTSAITTINKLHQIVCGHLKLDEGVEIEIPSNRIEAVLDIIDKMPDQKIVIWCRFQKDVEIVMRNLEAIDDKRYPVHYYGETRENDRRDNLLAFQQDPNCMWFVGTASTGGKGIDGLQHVCSYEIYYSNSYDREDRAQSEDRLDRKGQKNQVTIIDLIARGTVDTMIMDSLKRKEDLAHEVLDKLRLFLTKKP